MSDRRIRVAVIFGGRSGEHPVSCISAASVLANLDPDRFDVTAIGITTSGRWLQVDPAAVPALLSGPELPAVTDGAEVVLRTDTAAGVLSVPGTDSAPVLDVEVAFPLLHGPFGEDGTIQGLLELVGLPYVGPGVLASAAAMDKEFTKKLLVAAGLAVAPWVVLRPGTDAVAPADRELLGLPVFVKPARAGSSLGVSRVDAWSSLPDAVAGARRHDPKVLVEAAMPGREIECGVLEFPDGRVEASPAAEIRLSGDDRFYDFEAKYTDSTATFDIPAELDEPVERSVREAAVRAFGALDAQGLARVDFFVGDDGAVTVNEVNTMPGFTPMSMYPQMWLAAGMSYPELLSTLISTALARGTGLR